MAGAVVDAISDMYTHPAEIAVFQGHWPMHYLILHPHFSIHRNQHALAIPEVRSAPSGWQQKKRGRDALLLRVVARTVDENRLIRIVTDRAIHPPRMEPASRLCLQANYGVRKNHKIQHYSEAFQIPTS